MNSQWQIDLFTGLDSAESMQDVLDVTLKTTSTFGFESAGWRTELPLPMSRKRTLALNTVEDDVVEKHASGGYDNAPVPLHCSRSIEPIYWLGTMNDEMYSKVPDLCDEYYGWGHYGGWAQSFIASQSSFSMFWLDTPAPLSQKDIDNVYFKLNFISTIVLTRMNQVQTQKDIKLSMREKEVLRWSGDGKTADQIGKILSISCSTVNFHLRNAMYKLDAPNKTNAIVKAICLGLLY